MNKSRAPAAARSRVVAAILIVGEEPMLMEALADLLLGWQLSTTDSRAAAESIRSIRPDLLIICQSVPDETADELIELARKLNPSVRALGMCRPDNTRNLNAELYDADLHDPGHFRTVAARLLKSSPS